MVSCRILPIAESHIAGFCAAVDAVARERKYLSFLEGPPLERARPFVLGHIAENWPHFVAVDEGSQVVGWCDISGRHGQSAAHVGVLGIGVLAAWRGQGIGEALLRRTLHAAQTRGLIRVELTVNENNHRAAALYRKLGFVEEGIKRKATCIDGVYGDCTMMALLFD